MKARIVTILEVIIISSLLIQISYSLALAQGPYEEIEPNNTLGAAQNLETVPWFLDADPNIASSTTIPHLTINGSGDNSFDYYAFTVAKADDKGIFDIDSTTGGFDSWLTLYNSSGIILASNDDSGVNQGAGGSTTSLDSYLQYTFPTPGTYTIRVGARIGGPFDVIPIPPEMTYQLQVSIEGHPSGSSIYLPSIMKNWSPLTSTPTSQVMPPIPNPGSSSTPTSQAKPPVPNPGPSSTPTSGPSAPIPKTSTPTPIQKPPPPVPIPKTSTPTPTSTQKAPVPTPPGTAYVKVINNTGGTLTFNLSGPTSGSWTVVNGQTRTVDVIPGTYQFTATTTSCSGTHIKTFSVANGQTRTFSLVCG